MTGSDRRRKFEKLHYHDPIVEYQTTIAQQRIRIKALEEQIASMKAAQDNQPASLDNELISKRYEELTRENFQLRQQIKSMKKRLKEE